MVLQLLKFQKNGIRVTSIIPSSPAFKAGFKVGDVLYKPGSKGNRLLQNNNDTTVPNLMLHQNRPIILEALREISNEDIVKDVVVMEENVKKILKKAVGARTDVGYLFDNMCQTDI